VTRRRHLAADLALGLLLLWSALPLGFAVISSLRPEAQLFGAAGGGLTLEHYRALFQARSFLVPVRNSLVVASATTAWCLVVGLPCAYAVARLRFRGKTALLSLILATSMFPQVSVVSPLYLGLRRLGLLDTLPGLVLPYLTFALPLTVWLLVGFFRRLPWALEDAARVDGASRARALFAIILPLAAPGLAATAILTFVYCWNELLFALAFTVSPERRTVPVAIALMRGRYQVPWGQLLAAATAATVPLGALVLLAQRHLVRGLTAGAVKE
jgi:ABC-type glycerol-3-phosphate transport system permease component